ncbi:HEAT repeat domain-containing protein [Streptomyces sp. NPDC057302]|uniref:HEAT repeat domain-containing protein n=1 Tax=Streptomyces sp. NPDC057302 TaxID=3346094 RepID=UPI00363B086F
MFTKRRARKQAELHEELAAALRDPDAEVRRKASKAAAESGDLRWALGELTQAMEREPWAESFSETVVEGFAAALRRERALRERTEQIFTRYLDDPEGFVRAWTALTAELGGAPAVRDVDSDLRDDTRSCLQQLSDRAWPDGGLFSVGEPNGFLRNAAFDDAVSLACHALRGSTPLSEQEADQVRAETRTALKNALLHTPGSEERATLLAPFTPATELEAWTDRARAVIRADEALALCPSQPNEGGEGEGEDEAQDMVTLGVQALARILFGKMVRRDRVLETLDRLVARQAHDTQDPFLVSAILRCYHHLHRPMSLENPPLDLFMDGLRHPHPAVRVSAADGLIALAAGSPEEGRAVQGLVGLLEHDPDDGVRRTAAAELRWLDDGGTAHDGLAAGALERQADSADPEIRALSVSDALRRGAPDALDRLLGALASPDPHWDLLVGLSYVPDGPRRGLPSRSVRKVLIERLETLRDSGWAERNAPEDFTAGDAREELTTLLDTMRNR